MKLISIQKLTSESFFKITTLLPMLCNVESWLFLMPQTNGCGWLKKHPNPFGKLLWMERKLCSWRSGESSFKIELEVHHWRWSLNQNPRNGTSRDWRYQQCFQIPLEWLHVQITQWYGILHWSHAFKVTWASLEINEKLPTW